MSLKTPPISIKNIEIPHQQIADFCRLWKITELALFGSVLRDDFDRTSDVDVLVTFAPTATWTLLDHVTMQEQLKAIIGRDVDLVSRRGIERSRNHIRRQSILGSAEVIYARS